MKKGGIHFIGIGGTGMNGVAQLAAKAGYSVSGSDRDTGTASLAALEKIGIRIVPQDGSGITGRTGTVVYSTAVEEDNPDRLRALSLEIPLLHRADMLAELCRGREVIAVAGTAGKSTVTGLLGWIFEYLGNDPSVYCGAPVLNWKRTGGNPGNIRSGSGPWIIEADESDRSLLTFYPDHAIITNISEDHFSLPEVCALFEQFASQVRGILVKGSGTSAPVSVHPPASLAGKHNIENINNALTLCKKLGLDMKKCAEAVASFKGIERRLERVGSRVIDDFAHSPVKIAAALDAVSGLWPCFAACWRPHGYTPLFAGFSQLIDVFSVHWKKRSEDDLFILPVYYAGGTVEKKITSEEFAAKLRGAGVPARFAADYDLLEKQLLETGKPVLVMGARDPELPLFARRIAARLDGASAGPGAGDSAL